MPRRQIDTTDSSQKIGRNRLSQGRYAVLLLTLAPPAAICSTAALSTPLVRSPEHLAHWRRPPLRSWERCHIADSVTRRCAIRSADCVCRRLSWRASIMWTQRHSGGAEVQIRWRHRTFRSGGEWSMSADPFVRMSTGRLLLRERRRHTVVTVSHHRRWALLGLGPADH